MEVSFIIDTHLTCQKILQRMNEQLEKDSAL